MNSWHLKETTDGLRLSARRAIGSEEFTWADLLASKLTAVHVYVIYFPSRFDLAVDTTARDALASFGRETGSGTSVNFWDTTDPEFGRALAFFDLKVPPALVLMPGIKLDGIDPVGSMKNSLYSIAITNSRVLEDRQRLASRVNTAHEILLRSDPKEIVQYLRISALDALLEAIGRVADGVREEILSCRPKFGLPGGISIQLGA